MSLPDMESAVPARPRNGAKKADARKRQAVSEYHFDSPGSSALDRPARFTFFPDKFATSKSQRCESFREFAKRIPATVKASKGQLPYAKAATFGDELSRKGSLRHNANLRKISGIEADYDGEEHSVAWALAKLDDAGIAAVLSTTASHRPDAPRYRIFCPTSRDLEPEERAALVARLNGALDGALAPESFTLSQSFYYGGVKGQPAPRVEIVEGVAIDLADHLDAQARGKDGKLCRWPDDEPEDDDPGLMPEPDVERIRKALDVLPASALERYHDWLEIGQALHHEFGGDPEGMELWDAASQWCDSYDADELEAKWESFGSYSGKPVTIGTLYRLAKKHAPKPKRNLGGLTFETPAQCAVAPLQSYIMKGMIAEGDVGCIFGAPGAGKSLIAPFIGYQVALGESAFGMRTKQGTVFYCAAEDATGLRQRVAALRNRQGDAPALRVVSGISDLYAEDSPDLEQLLAAVKAERPKLIVIDTLAMAFPSLEENDAASMGRVVAVGRQLAEHGAAVIFIHHGTKADGSTPRGHSLFNGALDFSMQVEKGEDGIVRGRLRKNRRGTTEMDIAFRIGVEPLGEDEDGDEINAAVAEELAAGESTRTKRLPPSQRALLEILEELEAEGTVTNEQWMEVASEGFRVSQSEIPKARRDSVRRARSALHQLGLIIISKRGNVRTAHEAEDEECDI